MKGRSAAEELAADRRALERLGLVDAVVTEHGGDVLDEPVLTVDLRFEPKRQGLEAGRARAERPKRLMPGPAVVEQRRGRPLPLAQPVRSARPQSARGWRRPDGPGASWHSGAGAFHVKHIAAVHASRALGGRLPGVRGRLRLADADPRHRRPRRWTVLAPVRGPDRARPAPSARYLLSPRPPILSDGGTPTSSRDWCSRETCSGVAHASSLGWRRPGEYLECQWFHVKHARPPLTPHRSVAVSAGTEGGGSREHGPCARRSCRRRPVSRPRCVRLTRGRTFHVKRRRGRRRLIGSSTGTAVTGLLRGVGGGALACPGFVRLNRHALDPSRRWCV